MKISRKSIYQMTENIGEYVLLYEDVYAYEGPVLNACFGGASKTDKQLAQNESQFTNQLQSNYTSQFQGQKAILGQLSAAFEPIVAKGPSQYGFAPAEDSALRTQATEGTAQQYQNAKQATGEALASAGGGNSVLPTGTAAGLQANNAVAAAGQESQQLLGITNAGYQQGNQNFNNAAAGLSGVASQMQPLGYAGAATSASGQAFSEADTVNQEEQAAKQQMWSTIGGIAGAGASFIPGVGGAVLGKVIGGATGSIGGGGGDGGDS